VGVNDARNGPVALVAGRGEVRDGEIVIDEVFARKEGISLGDTLRVAGQTLQVVGVEYGVWGELFLPCWNSRA
jgi:hypothetical protein